MKHKCKTNFDNMTMLSFYNVILIRNIRTNNTLYYIILMKIEGKMIIYKLNTTITLKEH
jgi:hypothetical protein